MRLSESERARCKNSLNQAFIRAYAKERDANSAHAANQASEAQAAAQRVNEQLIMRIDTATVDIPQPHLSTRPVARQVAAVPAGTQRAAAAERTPRRERTEEDELRATIASEMLRAGGWQSEQIAALGPITPPGFDKRSEPSEIDEHPAPTSNYRNGPRGHIDREEIAESDAFEPAYDHYTVRNSSSTDAPRYPDREREAIPTPPVTSQPVPEFMQHVKSGSIVRLDRPLGTTTQSQSPTAPAANQTAKATQTASKMPSAMPSHASTYADEAIDDENAAYDFQPTISMHEAVQYHRKPTSVASAAQAVERELRRAKVRVFNPTWEVDQLQWPDVCVKLMEARMDSLTLVTKHLIEACQEGLQVLAVTSPEGGEGRTTVACCLALLAGSRGLKVAIVDGDIENPTLCVQTNLEIENDWQSAIVNECRSKKLLCIRSMIKSLYCRWSRRWMKPSCPRLINASQTCWSNWVRVSTW